MDAETSDYFASWPIPTIDADRCRGCGLCVAACPTGTLSMQDEIAFVASRHTCQYHGNCEVVCPYGAIQLWFCIIE